MQALRSERIRIETKVLRNMKAGTQFALEDDVYSQVHFQQRNMPNVTFSTFLRL